MREIQEAFTCQKVTGMISGHRNATAETDGLDTKSRYYAYVHEGGIIPFQNVTSMLRMVYRNI